jgi:hypothetical protein
MKFLVMVRTVVIDTMDAVLAIFPSKMTTEEPIVATPNKEGAKGTEEKKKKHTHHHSGRRLRHHRPRNPTLAESGGLPPVKNPGE